jgi:hypothetical protein
MSSEVITYFGDLDLENVWVEGIFSFYQEHRRSRDSVIGIVTRLPARRPRNRGSIPGRGKKVFKNIPDEKSPLESQERDGWTMLKMI